MPLAIRFDERGEVRIVYLKLFFTFAKIGFLGFGGGLAILPMIYRGVSGFTSITPAEFANLFGISQATPGPIAINAATFVGFKAAGLTGAMVATVGVSLPSFVLVIIVANFLKRNRENSLVEGAFIGIRPMTVGMITSAALYVGTNAILTVPLREISGIAEFAKALNPVALVMAAATFILVKKTKLGAIKLIIIMGAIGAIYYGITTA